MKRLKNIEAMLKGFSVLIIGLCALICGEFIIRMVRTDYFVLGNVLWMALMIAFVFFCICILIEELWKDP